MFPMFPENNPYFFVIAIWAGIYILLANILLISFIFKCRGNQKIEALITCLVITPGLFVSLYTDYFMGVLKNFSFFNYRRILIFCIVMVALILIYRYGVLGIRLKFVKIGMDTSMNSAFLGVSIINHAIKNEIAKISMCADSIQLNNHTDNDTIFKSANIIQNSVDHLSSIMNKVRENVRDITITEKEIVFDIIVNSALNLNKTVIQEHQIEIVKNYNKNIVLFCDEVHMTEVFNNIFINSIEAMGMGGKIIISSGNRNRWFYIKVEDIGKGIPKSEISNVFNPFFTTKNGGMNFGLGLSYCYNVMKKHNGALEITSRESLGTSVFLYFPLNKVKQKIF
jgi:signal transduction histidine kinase